MSPDETKTDVGKSALVAKIIRHRNARCEERTYFRELLGYHRGQMKNAEWLELDLNGREGRPERVVEERGNAFWKMAELNIFFVLAVQYLVRTKGWEYNADFNIKEHLIYRRGNHHVSNFGYWRSNIGEIQPLDSSEVVQPGILFVETVHDAWSGQCDGVSFLRQIPNIWQNMIDHKALSLNAIDGVVSPIAYENVSASTPPIKLCNTCEINPGDFYRCSSECGRFLCYKCNTICAMCSATLCADCAVCSANLCVACRSRVLIEFGVDLKQSSSLLFTPRRDYRS